MEYSKILKQAFEFTKKHRSMWWLGMLVASSGGGASNINIPSDFGESAGPSGAEMDAYVRTFTDWAVTYWYILVMIGLLLLALALLSIVLHFIATAGMYYGANDARLGKKPTFKNMFKAGVKPFWRLAGLHILIGLGSFLAIGIPLALIILLGITIIGLVVAIPAFIIFIIALFPFIAALSIITTYASQYVVLEDARIIDSLRQAWKLFRSTLGDSVVMYLLSIVVGIAMFLITAAVAIMVMIPFAIIGFIAYNASGWIPVIIVAAIGLILLSVILLIIKGIKHTYAFNMWHLTFAELKTR